jgi:hypothetical protein
MENPYTCLGPDLSIAALQRPFFAAAVVPVEVAKLPYIDSVVVRYHASTQPR